MVGVAVVMAEIVPVVTGGCWECSETRGLGKGMRSGGEGPAEVRGCDLCITWAPGCMMLTVSADWM